jgi:flagellar hook-associated protein 3 FlgL
MRIVFNTTFERGIRAVSDAAESLTEAQRQVASGRRIERPSQDPLGTANAIVEHQNLDRLEASQNATEAANYRLGVADNALSDIINQLTSAQSATLSARGSSQTQAQRDAAANELLAIRDALMADINTKLQGTYLFSGSSVTTAPFAATGGGISAYQGDANVTSIEYEAGKTVASTFDGGQIFQGSDTAHILDALTTLAADVAVNNQAGIQAGVDAIGRAFDRATVAQTQVGNQLRVLDDTRARLSFERTGAIARLSSIEDADLAEAAARLAQADTAYRAALGSVATLGRISLMDYLR